MNTISTAEEIVLNKIKNDLVPNSIELYLSKFKSEGGIVSDEDICNYAIEFAKLHVKAALEAASKNVRTTCVADRFLDGYDPSEDYEGNIFYKESILNCYPENLIK